MRARVCEAAAGSAGAAKEPFDAEVTQMLEKLGLHNSYFDRKAAFDELSRRVDMELDTDVAY